MKKHSTTNGLIAPGPWSWFLPNPEKGEAKREVKKNLRGLLKALKRYLKAKPINHNLIS